MYCGTSVRRVVRTALTPNRTYERQPLSGALDKSTVL